MRSQFIVVFSLTSLGLLFSGCGGESKTAGPVTIKGAGASAPLLVYEKWAESYAKVDPLAVVQYRATGSGEGIKELIAGNLDFAASDMPIDDEDLAKVNRKLLHFPALMTAIVPVYHLAGVETLQLDGETLARIFLGKIKTWNDPAIAKANPGVKLPAAKIAVLHRSDASGSTYVLTDYLTKVSEEWKKGPGRGAKVNFTEGAEAAGNDSLSELVQKTPNSISYVDVNYAIKYKLAAAAVKNAAGQYRTASLESMSGALEMAEGLQKDFRKSVVNSPGAKSYPICTLTWLIVPAEFTDGPKGRAVKRFLRWAFTDGQQMAMQFDYGIIQPPLIERIRDQVDAIKAPNN